METAKRLYIGLFSVAFLSYWYWLTFGDTLAIACSVLFIGLSVLALFIEQWLTTEDEHPIKWFIAEQKREGKL
jgi:inner membrane protein involved in colicin E2 resistance